VGSHTELIQTVIRPKTDAVLALVIAMAADILRMPSSSLNADASPANVKSWDSVEHLNLVLSLEQRFSVEFQPDEIEQMNSLGKIVELLEQKFK
jgi:acyl carrier protein